MFDAGVRAHYTASRLAAPLMISKRSGLIVNVSFGDRGKYLGNLIYDVSKSSINRLAEGMALELKEHNVAAVALFPGFVRTERILQGLSSDELAETESPFYIGRAVAALAADKNIMEKTGKLLLTGDLATEYDFTDIDGKLIPAFEIPDTF